MICLPSTLKDSSDLPNATIADNECIYFRDRNAVQQWSIAMSNSTKHFQSSICIGLDCKWSIHDGANSITRLLQLSFLQEKAAVINLSLMKALDKQ